MPYRISRLGHVEIRSLDLDRDLEHYVDVLGLHLSEGRSADVPGRT
jgi:catechol 2,3-dioxygenase-like lactoylglutathione lyase family enzyme